MFIGAHEWSLPKFDNSHAKGSFDVPSLYDRLLNGKFTEGTRLQAAGVLRNQLAQLDERTCNLPESVDDLESWMLTTAQSATTRYGAYLAGRKAGAPRSYFSNRSHALYFLRSVAPTKLVDGAWLFGLMRHWRNPRLAHLVRTYVEEIGEGAPDKNHVLIYRQLLQRHGIDSLNTLDESLYMQGLIQLALAYNAEEFLPEVIGFNLGYEQLPLHLLITAYELNELGVDPYYFTLHITVDNTDTGHARRAVQAVMDILPKFGDTGEFWQRVRKGCQLGDAGVGTCAIIDGFDIEREVVRIFSHKSTAGQGAHSDYCRLAGLSVNDWLGDPAQIPAFLAALEKAAWIKHGEPVKNSRFWGLLQGPRAEMFGVFSSYELQLIHDWIRGDASADGLAYYMVAPTIDIPRRPSFRVAARLASIKGGGLIEWHPTPDLLDSDLQAMLQELAKLDSAGKQRLLVEAMSPSLHWMPAGLHATRLFCQQAI